MEIYLIRHTSVEVEKGVCYGQTDVPLKNSFEEEAATTAACLNGIRFDRVYTSPLSRCLRLAEYCGYPDAIRDRRILELDFGEWEMQKFDEIRDPGLEKWYNDYLNVSPTGGESFRMQLQRVSAFIDEIRQLPCKRIGIFAHGGVLLCAQIHAGTLKLEDAFSALTPYGGIVRLEMPSI